MTQEAHRPSPATVRANDRPLPDRRETADLVLQDDITPMPGSRGAMVEKLP